MSRQSATLSFAAQHAILPESGERSVLTKLKYFKIVYLYLSGLDEMTMYTIKSMHEIIMVWKHQIYFINLTLFLPQTNWTVCNFYTFQPRIKEKMQYNFFLLFPPCFELLDLFNLLLFISIYYQIWLNFYGTYY